MLLVFLFNSTCYTAEANNKRIFCESEIEGSLEAILSEDLDFLSQQYSNVLSVETIELSGELCSNGEIVEAYELNQDGTVCSLETEVTLTKILYQEEQNLSLKRDEKPSTLYVMTAETYSSDTTKQHGVRLTGCIAWIDHLGVDNELVALSGSRSGSYTGIGTYYCNSGTTTIAAWKTFSDVSFFDNSAKGEKGYSFQLLIHSPSTQSTQSAQLIIRTSIFD